MSASAGAAACGVASPQPPTPQKQLPIDLWGLDPAYWSCYKLLISTLHAMPTAAATLGIEGAPGYHLHGHPVAKAEVMGIIVAVLAKNAFVSYSIDDGSGIVHCNCWYNQNAAFSTPGGGSSTSQPPTATNTILPAASASALHSMPAAFRRTTPTTSVGFVSTPMQLLEMGNLVRVRGRITQFRERREIAVESLFVETDSNAETLHWLEVMQLMQEVYSQPSQILLESRAARIEESAQLAATCMAWLADTKTDTFTLHSMLSVPELYRIAHAQAQDATANQKAIAAGRETLHRGDASPSAAAAAVAPFTPLQCCQSALDYLVQLGSVLKFGSDDSTARYEVTSLERHVVPLVFSIIASASASVGLHRDGVIAAVQSRHTQLNATIVQEAISVLVERSDICEWETPLTYVCTNPAAAEDVDM